jgi:hypothetical protein
MKIMEAQSNFEGMVLWRKWGSQKSFFDRAENQLELN